MSKHILFKLASRQRPTQLIAAIENIKHFVVDKFNYSILISLDEDDPTIHKMFPSMQSIVDFKSKYPNAYLHFGVSKNKIHAINRDIEKHPTDWHILVNFSDDMEWTVAGFDDIIREGFEKNGYNNFMHILDQCPYNDSIAAMSVMGREYYEKFGFIYNPVYYSFFCDNEALDIAKMTRELIDLRGKGIMFLHKHYSHDNKYSRDGLYDKNNVHFPHDRDIYYKRLSNNFKD